MLNGKNQLEAGVEAIEGLLNEFRKGNIADKGVEKEGLGRHLGELSERWDEQFPGFPESRIHYASFWGVMRRGVRDRYLRNIIVRLLEAKGRDRGDKTLVNIACVFGRHARHLASRLGQFRVIATDLDPTGHWFYEHVLRCRIPANYEFRKDDLFNSQVDVAPTAVVFFGACGSLTDAAMDYAIQSNTPYLICRTCCYDNIGGNTKIKMRFTPINWIFRYKNFVISRRWLRKKGLYFSDKYSRDRYPISRTARGLSNSDEFMEISRNSVDSGICRAIIDLDRYLRLAESGYKVWYKGELFVAERINDNR